MSFDISMTRMSSKGQIVIPSEMRDDFPAGEKMVILRSGDDLLLRKASKLTEKMREDMEFAMRTEEVLRKYERGEGNFRTLPMEDFLKEVKRWQKEGLKKTLKSSTKR